MFQVGSNGIISLNTSYNPARSESLPISRYKFVAPFWADIDTRGTGATYYRQTNNSALLARATNEIQMAFPLAQEVNVTNLLIVTWSAVGYYPGGIDKVMDIYYIYVSKFIKGEQGSQKCN